MYHLYLQYTLGTKYFTNCKTFNWFNNCWKSLENIIDRNDDQIEHKDYNNFNTDAFKKDIDEIDWSLATGNTDVNLSFEIFLRLIGKILDKHGSLKKTSTE